MLYLIMAILLFPIPSGEAELGFTYTPETITTYNTMEVEVTWYTSRVQETDSTPFITADGSRTRDGVVAISPDMMEWFSFGDSLYVEYLGWFEIHDIMNHRYTRSIDIWCNNHHVAFHNGRITTNIYWGFHETTIYHTTTK